MVAVYEEYGTIGTERVCVGWCSLGYVTRPKAGNCCGIGKVPIMCCCMRYFGTHTQIHTDTHTQTHTHIDENGARTI